MGRKNTEHEEAPRPPSQWSSDLATAAWLDFHRNFDQFPEIFRCYLRDRETVSGAIVEDCGLDLLSGKY